MTETIETLTDDPTGREATRRRVEAEVRAETIEGGLKVLKVEAGRLAPTLHLLKLQESLADARDALSTAQAEETAAKSAARARIAAARKPGRVALLKALLVAAERARDAALAVHEYDQASAAAVGLAVGAAPLPALLTLPFADLQRQITGPPAKAPAPGPKSGEVRVRLPRDGVLDSFFDRDAEYGGHYYARGDVFDIPRRGVRDLLKTGALVEVEAGA